MKEGECPRGLAMLAGSANTRGNNFNRNINHKEENMRRGLKVGDICKSIKGTHPFDPCKVEIVQNWSNGKGVHAKVIGGVADEFKKEVGPKASAKKREATWVYEESQLKLVKTCDGSPLPFSKPRPKKKKK